MKLWEGRFAAPTAADADAFNESLSFDKKLYKADITASIAHATMLGECGIISLADARNELVLHERVDVLLTFNREFFRFDIQKNG